MFHFLDFHTLLVTISNNFEKISVRRYWNFAFDITHSEKCRRNFNNNNICTTNKPAYKIVCKYVKLFHLLYKVSLNIHLVSHTRGIKLLQRSAKAIYWLHRLQLQLPSRSVRPRTSKVWTLQSACRLDRCPSRLSASDDLMGSRSVHTSITVI